MTTFNSRWDDWSSIRSFGNSKLVQSTWIVPVVGYVILFGQEWSQYLLLKFDGEVGIPYRAYFLYFGFCSLAFGSLLYTLRCPPEIKSHASDYDFLDKRFPVMHKNSVVAMYDALGKEVNKAEDAPFTKAVVAKLMQDYYAYQNCQRAISRRFVLFFYTLGISILAIPTVQTFLAVGSGFVRTLMS